MPTPCRLAAVATPSLRASEVLPLRPIWPGERWGAPESRFTKPPSWSIITSSGAPSAASRGMACRRASCARSWLRDAMLRLNRITPAASPRAIRRSSAAGGRSPEYA